jgi:hypothetical protein
MVGHPSAKWRPAGVGVTKLNAIGVPKRKASIIQIEAMLNLIQSRIDEMTDSTIYRVQGKI